MSPIHSLMVACWVLFPGSLLAAEPFFVWPDLAPGETSRSIGEAMPARPDEDPPVTRVINVRRPTIEVFSPTGEPNGTAVVILPGGGFSKVVPDLEGSEAAERLARHGVTAFVVNYRTNEALPEGEPNWKRPLQDAQRAVRLVRAQAEKWKLRPDRIGLMAFSAGGQVGAMQMTAKSSAYAALDEIDSQSFHPDFVMLIYPWQVLERGTEKLLPQIQIAEHVSPTFIVHTHDDRSSSLGAVEIYSALKRHGVSAELHIYENGGHGYGIRSRPNSNIGTWINRGIEWLQVQGLAN